MWYDVFIPLGDVRSLSVPWRTAGALTFPRLFLLYHKILLARTAPVLMILPFKEKGAAARRGSFLKGRGPRAKIDAAPLINMCSMIIINGADYKV